MTRRAHAIAALALAAAACTQEEQTLPFDPSSNAEVATTVGANGANLSLPSGASIRFPAGAFSGSVTMGRTTAPASVSALGGSVFGNQVIELGPSGQPLSVPADFAVTLPTSNPDAWLTSFAITTPTGTVVDPNVNVDLNNGIARGKLTTLGTVTPFVPSAQDVITLDQNTSNLEAALVSADAFSGPVATISQNCGLGSGLSRCVGVTASASPELLAKLESATSARLIAPRVTGTLTTVGDPRLPGGAGLQGSITFEAGLRAQLSRGNNTNPPQGVAARVRLVLAANGSTRIRQDGDVLTISNATVTAAEPQVGSTPVTFQLTSTSNAGVAVFRYAGSVDLGNGSTGQVIVRFPFNIGY